MGDLATVGAGVTMADETSPGQVSRRRFLQAGLVTGTACLAGCGQSDGENQTAIPGSQSVFREVTVDGTYLDVVLHEDTAVSAVSLIAPDGSEYESAEVATGVTRVQFQLLELELQQASHYTPGEYTLVAKLDGDTESRSVTLRPDLQIQEIRQCERVDIPAAKARIAVEIKNVGTAPTWVYDIAYRNPPNWGANDDLGSRPGIPHLALPEPIENTLLHPGGIKVYVASNQPLRFPDQSGDQCDISTEMTVILGTGTGEPIEQQIRVEATGQPRSPDSLDRFLCTDVSIEQANSESKSTANNSGDS